jgi:hypothetical protein
MIDSREDFWPSDFPDAVDPAPVALLKEQAALLSEKTNGEIEAVVQMTFESGTAYHILYLTSNAIGELMVGILMLSYPACKEHHNVYPITCTPPGDNAAGYGSPVTIGSEPEFKRWLREQLSSKYVISTIGVLKSYIRDLAKARSSWAS